nr:MAG TPA: hypothetical protein [Caudoviricetes sp.]
MKFCITKENPTPNGTGQHLIKMTLNGFVSSSAAGVLLSLSSFA